MYSPNKPGGDAMDLTKYKNKTTFAILAAVLVIGMTIALIKPPSKVIEPQLAENNQAPQEVSAPANPLESIKTHTVSEGETLGAIASQYNVDLDTILGANPDVDETNIHPGDKLVILPQKGVIHTTDMGDTLWSIANSYSIDVAAIMTSNAKASEDLAIGEKVFIPGGKPISKDEKMLARADYTVSRANPGRFSWPARGELSSHFGYRWGRLHAGVDIANDIGTPVTAPMSGRVTSAGWESGYGYRMTIEHANGYETLYGHLSEFAVSTGSYVRAGQTIAYMGNTGYSTGPHLHFEVHKDGRVIDPLNVLP